MTAHVFMTSLDKKGKRVRCEDMPSILSLFLNKFYKFNNTKAKMHDSLYHMTLKLYLICNFHTKT